VTTIEVWLRRLFDRLGSDVYDMDDCGCLLIEEHLTECRQ
jgi:hypothetical protein